jgi:hypothetical protein
MPTPDAPPRRWTIPMKTLLAAAGALALITAAGAADAAISVTYTAGPFSTVALGNGGVETFDNAVVVNNQLDATFGSFTGTYTGVQINPADQYTSAALNNYAVTFSYTAAYTLVLDQAVNYFGFFNEAADTSNTVQFYSAGHLVGTYTSSIANQQAAFANIVSSQKFDTLVFSDTFPRSEGTHGFESDNHTVADVPEPAAWALMIVGFGGVGATLRRRNRRAAALTA